MINNDDDDDDDDESIKVCELHKLMSMVDFFVYWSNIVLPSCDTFVWSCLLRT